MLYLPDALVDHVAQVAWRGGLTFDTIQVIGPDISFYDDARRVFTHRVVDIGNYE